MEEEDKGRMGAAEAAVLTGNKETTHRVSSHPSDEEPGVSEEEEEVEEEMTYPEAVTTLQRELTLSVTNIQTAADARELMRRRRLAEARKKRMEWLKNNQESSREKCDEINLRWQTVKEKTVPQELQEALMSQQQLCDVILEEKKALISDLQQELKLADDRFVKDLRKQEEELSLMIDRMEEQIKTLSAAYREEMGELEKYYVKESEVLHTKDKSEWQQHLKHLWEEELDRLEKRKKTVVEFEAKIHDLMMENIDKQRALKIENNAPSRVIERESQHLQASITSLKLQQIKEKSDAEAYKFALTQTYKKINGLQLEEKNLKMKRSRQTLGDTIHYLTKDYKRKIQQSERLEKQIKHFAVANIRKYEEMWQTLDAEVCGLTESAIIIDSIICEQHLGIAWQRPAMPFREPPNPAKQAGTLPGAGAANATSSAAGAALQSSPNPEGAGSEGESTAVEREKEEEEEDEDEEEEEVSIETMMRVMELLCDETGFLMEENIMLLLAPLVEEDKKTAKLCLLLSTMGITDEAIPKLAHFLLKWKRQQAEDLNELSDQASSSSSDLTSDLIHPNDVLPALKTFLQEHMKSRKGSGHHQSYVLQTEPLDNSADRVYLKALGDIISEDRIKLWEGAERMLQQYLQILTQISALIPETESLEVQNSELRRLLHASLKP